MTPSPLSRRQFFLAPALLQRAAGQRPNIVLILADDLGWGDLSSTGAPDIATPRIDSIARQGVQFSNSYANAPECTPTRCGLLTGRYQQRAGGLECAIGVNNLGRYDEAEWLQKRDELGLPPEHATLAPLLSKSGYDTAIFGKWHLGYLPQFWPRRHGFGEFFGLLGGNADYYTHEEMGEGSGQRHFYRNEERVNPPGNTTDLIADSAIEFLRAARRKPFLLYLPFTSPHDPLQNPAEFDNSTGTAPHRPRDRATYCRMVEHLDRRVGDILSELDRRGMSENTLVVFHSDNGGTAVGRNLPWRGTKSTVFEGGIRSPLYLRWPGRIAAGKTCAQPAMTMDLTATFLQAAGADIRNARLDGIDLMPFITGRRAAQERTLFWRYKRGRNRRKAVREGHWKYVFDTGNKLLFDLEKDPGERSDLSREHPKVLAKLEENLQSWETETASPRLRDFQQSSL